VYLKDLVPNGLSTSQLIGIVSCVFGLALLVGLVRKYRRDPVGSRLWEIPLPELATESGPPATGGATSSTKSSTKRRKRR
jgi:hypothetical protein